MQIYIDDQEIQATINDQSSIHHTWNSLMERITLENMYVKCVQINGELYYDDYETIIFQMFNKIEIIKILTISTEAKLADIVDMIIDYNPKFLLGTRSIAQYFYGELEERHWQEFSSFMEGLDWLYKSIEVSLMLIKRSQCLHAYEDRFNKILHQLEPQLIELEMALNNKDYVTVGDLMIYEIATVFEQLIENPVN